MFWRKGLAGGLVLATLGWTQASRQTIVAPTPKVGDHWTYEKKSDPNAGVFYWEVLTIGPEFITMRYKNSVQGETIGYKSLDFGSVLQIKNEIHNAIPSSIKTSARVFHDYKIFDFPLYKHKQYDFHAYWRSGHLQGEDVGQCKVGDVETVSVSSHNYTVVKINCQGTWRYLNNVAKHTLHKEYWYAPLLKNYVYFKQDIYENGTLLSSETYLLKDSINSD